MVIRYENNENMSTNEILIRYFNGKSFKHLSFDIFYMVLMAVLLERSIIFVSNSKNRLSSTL